MARAEDLSSADILQMSCAGAFENGADAVTVSAGTHGSFDAVVCGTATGQDGPMDENDGLAPLVSGAISATGNSMAAAKLRDADWSYAMVFDNWEAQLVWT